MRIQRQVISVECLRQIRRGNSHAGRSPSAARSAFTLIELLVVIAIIALLAALPLPALAPDKARAKTIECMSHLHQMTIAAHVYVDDNAGLYPIAYWFDEETGNYYCWDLTTTIDGGVLPGLLWSGR